MNISPWVTPPNDRSSPNSVRRLDRVAGHHPRHGPLNGLEHMLVARVAVVAQQGPEQDRLCPQLAVLTTLGEAQVGGEARPGSRRRPGWPGSAPPRHARRRGRRHCPSLMQCRSQPSRQLPWVSAFHHRNWADHSVSSDNAPRSLAVTPAVSRSAPKMSSSTRRSGASRSRRPTNPLRLGSFGIWVCDPPADDDRALREQGGRNGHAGRGRCHGLAAAGEPSGRTDRAYATSASRCPWGVATGISQPAPTM